MSPGRVLVFLKKSDKGTYYPVFRRAGIIPVKGNYVSWAKDSQWTKVETLLLSEVFNDIKMTQNKLKIAHSK